MSNKLDEVKEANVDLEKREFMGKVGKYAAVGAGMATLMTPTLSTANSYSTLLQNNGWGNKDQCIPGKSYLNQAENTDPVGVPANNDKHGLSDPEDTDPDEKPYNQ